MSRTRRGRRFFGSVRADLFVPYEFVMRLPRSGEQLHYGTGDNVITNARTTPHSPPTWRRIQSRPYTPERAPQFLPDARSARVYLPMGHKSTRRGSRRSRSRVKMVFLMTVRLRPHASEVAFCRVCATTRGLIVAISVRLNATSAQGRSWRSERQAGTASLFGAGKSSWRSASRYWHRRTELRCKD